VASEAYETLPRRRINAAPAEAFRDLPLELRYASWSGGPSTGRRQMTERRELYRSPNGDAWYLGREPQNGHAFIIHQPNAPSGGRLTHIELGAFLNGADGPEQKALLRLIATLVDLPPFGERT
jgi:hypothetical protein